MLVAATSLEESTEVCPEDEARAAIYGLIAHILHAPPSNETLNAIASQAFVIAEGDTPLQIAWRELHGTAGKVFADQIRQEYDDLFSGAGKPEVMLYGSFYLSGFLMEKPLARLREHLSELGLSRRLPVGEPEDHIAALCETMRVLIAGHENFAPTSLETQKDFFERHLASWAQKLAEALARNPISKFYSDTGKFIQAFFHVENESFEIA